jgi:hypothetical protein
MSLENVTLPPGFSTGYHSHDQDIIFVITAGAKIKNQVLGKEPVELEFKLGEVRFAPYTKTPGTHQITNGHLEKLVSIPIARCSRVNVHESERERNGII